MGGAGRYPSRIALVPPWGDSGGHGAPWRAALHSLRTAPTGACTPAALHLLITSLTTNANTLMVQSIYQRIYSISSVYTYGSTIRQHEQTKRGWIKRSSCLWQFCDTGQWWAIPGIQRSLTNPFDRCTMFASRPAKSPSKPLSKAAMEQTYHDSNYQ